MNTTKHCLKNSKGGYVVYIDMKEPLHIVIDGGGTKTIAILFRENGEILKGLRKEFAANVQLIEKAEQTLSDKKAEQLEKKLRENKLDLNDMLMQFEDMKKMGPMKEILSMIPGVGKKLKDTDVDDKQVDYTMAIIRSMTMKERENPDIINPSRKRRIAAGCGLKVEDVNRLLNQYRQIQKVYKQLNGAGSKKMMKRMQRMGGMPGMGGFPNMPNFPM